MNSYRFAMTWGRFFLANYPFNKVSFSINWDSTSVLFWALWVLLHPVANDGVCLMPPNWAEQIIQMASGWNKIIRTFSGRADDLLRFEREKQRGNQYSKTIMMSSQIDSRSVVLVNNKSTATIYNTVSEILLSNKKDLLWKVQTKN